MTNETQRRTYKELLKAYDQVITERDSWKRWCEEAEAKRAASPCACGGKEPLAEWDGWYPTYASPDDQPARYIVLPRGKP